MVTNPIGIIANNGVSKVVLADVRVIGLRGPWLVGYDIALLVDEAVRLGVSAASLTLRHHGAVYTKLSLELLYDQLR